MKPLLFKIRSGRAPTHPGRVDREIGDDTLGRGMDLALTVLVFLGFGWLLDRWLGTQPLFMIAFVVVAAVGSFVKMKYTYDASMERLEAERVARRTSAPPAGSPIEDAA